MTENMDAPDVEEGKKSEDEIAPFIGGGDECTDEAAHDEHPSHEHGGEDVGEREARRERKEQQHEWEGDKPLDVADELRLQASGLMNDIH